jgi:RHS repeat-associated protein
MNASGAIFYRFPDHLGNARIDSKPSGAFFSANSYGPFGEQYATSGAGDGAFTGYQQNEFSDGLYDFPFRKFSSSQGRWISPDPLGVGAVTLTNPQSWNRYAYVLNNPMASIDPLGLEVDACDGNAVCYDGGDPTDGGVGRGHSRRECRRLLHRLPIVMTTVQKFVCKASPGARVFASVKQGAIFGLVRGGASGFIGEEIAEPLGGGIPGAILGGFLGGTLGASGGVFTGSAIAIGCSLAGAYGGG